MVRFFNVAGFFGCCNLFGHLVNEDIYLVLVDYRRTCPGLSDFEVAYCISRLCNIN